MTLDPQTEEFKALYAELPVQMKLLVIDVINALAEGTDARHIIMAATWLPKSQREEMCKSFDRTTRGRSQ